MKAISTGMASATSRSSASRAWSVSSFRRRSVMSLNRTATRFRAGPSTR